MMALGLGRAFGQRWRCKMMIGGGGTVGRVVAPRL